MTPAKFAVTYLAVFGVLLGWWAGLQASTQAGVWLTVAVAYALPVVGWVVVRTALGGRGTTP